MRKQEQSQKHDRYSYAAIPSKPNSPLESVPLSLESKGSRALPVRCLHKVLYVFFSFWSSPSSAAALLARAMKEACCACRVEVIAVSRSSHSWTFVFFFQTCIRCGNTCPRKCIARTSRPIQSQDSAVQHGRCNHEVVGEMDRSQILKHVCG